MSTLPALNYISNAARTEGEVKQAFEDMLAGIKQIPGAGVAESTLTIASDSITPPGGGPGIFSVDTEAAAANDNLAIIGQTNFPDGSKLLLRLANASHTVTVKHAAGGAGQLTLQTGGDFTLGAINHWLMLKRTGTNWEEIARFPRLGMQGILNKATTYTVTEADRGQVIDCTTTFSLNLLAAARAGIGFDLVVRNSGTGIITIDGNASELIDGATTLLLLPGDLITIVCDAAQWKSVTHYTGPGRTLLATKVAAASAVLDFTGLTGFAAYEFELSGVLPVTNTAQLYLRVSEDNGGTFKAGAADYQYTWVAYDSSGASGLGNSGSASAIVVHNNCSNNASWGISGTIRSNDLALATLHTFTIHLAAVSGTPSFDTILGAGAYFTDLTAINAVRFLFNSGNIATGTIRCYGLRK